MISQMNPKGNEVRVLHVVKPLALSVPPQMAAGYTPELEEQVKEGQDLVARAAQTLCNAGFRVDTAVLKGDVREKITDAAAEWQPDLIVLGSHGRSGIGRLLLGSVAEFVARHAQCSVEIVRTPIIH